MPDAKSILNLGLGKIAASRIVSMDPPRSPIEKHCAQGYVHWRDLELAKRDWMFAYISGYPLTSEGPPLTSPTDGRAYRFGLPTDFIRPLRSKATEWERRGGYLYSASSTHSIAIRQASTSMKVSSNWFSDTRVREPVR